MLVHVKRTRSYRNGERARGERRCNAKIAAIDDQIEPGRLVLLVRWGSSSAVALRRRTADGGRASVQLAWGDRARDTAVADVDLADVRSLPGQRKPNSFLSRTVHQVAVICRFALLGGTTQKTRGGARISERKKGRPFGRTFRHCSRARNHRGAVRRARSLRAGKQAELRPKCRIREFGGFRVLVSWPPPPSTARLLDGRPVFRCWWSLARALASFLVRKSGVGTAWAGLRLNPFIHSSIRVGGLATSIDVNCAFFYMRKWNGVGGFATMMMIMN